MLKAAVTLCCLFSSSRNSVIAFEVERIANKLRLLCSHEALKVYGYAVVRHRFITRHNALLCFPRSGEGFGVSLHLHQVNILSARFFFSFFLLSDCRCKRKIPRNCTS